MRKSKCLTEPQVALKQLLRYCSARRNYRQREPGGHGALRGHKRQQIPKPILAGDLSSRWFRTYPLLRRGVHRPPQRLQSGDRFG